MMVLVVRLRMVLVMVMIDGAGGKIKDGVGDGDDG